MKSLMFSILVLVIIIGQKGYPYEMKCKPDALAALKSQELSLDDVNVTSDDNCGETTFCIEIEFIKEKHFKNLNIKKGDVAGICMKNVANVTRKEPLPFVVNKSIHCKGQINFSLSPNRFCQCRLAKPLKYGSVTIPENTDVEFDDKLNLAQFQAIKDDVIEGKVITRSKKYQIIDSKVVDSKLSFDFCTSGWD